MSRRQLAQVAADARRLVAPLALFAGILAAGSLALAAFDLAATVAGGAR